MPNFLKNKLEIAKQNPDVLEDTIYLAFSTVVNNHIEANLTIKTLAKFAIAMGISEDELFKRITDILQEINGSKN